MSPLTYRNGVSIAEIVFYVPSLCIAGLLAFRHGLGQNACWLFLIIFCLARIIGPAIQLAEKSEPKNLSLYEGSAILQNVGLSPLMLATIGLLSRLLDSINKAKRTILHSTMFHLIHLIILLGLILGIVGGIDAANNYVSSGTYTPTALNKAGIALFIVAYVAIVAIVTMTSFQVSHAEKGEKRLFFAVVISLFFLLVRLLYSIISTFTHRRSFNLLNGNVTVILCMALIQEAIVVALYGGTGLTLKRKPVQVHCENTHQTSTHHSARPLQDKSAGAAQAAGGKPNKENFLLKAAKFTIIGHLVTAVMLGKNQDVEMQQQK